MKTTKAVKPALTVMLATSTYGNQEPTLMVQLPKGTHWRVMSATLYRLAADVEMASLDEKWAVKTDGKNSECGYVALELCREADIGRAMAMLRSIVEAHRK